MDKETVKENESKGEEYSLPCGRCLFETYHKVVMSIDVDGEARDWDYSYTNKYQIVQCQGCRTFSFRYYHTNSEDFFHDDEGGTLYAVTQNLYPSRVAGRQKLNHTHFLPPSVASVYEETHSALCNKLPVLAGIGIRALIETVCKEKAASGHNLEQRIDGLVGMGVLTSEGAEILHSLRILGNEAAHEVKPHSETTLGTAMDVVEHLLQGVYILPKVAGRLPKRNSTTT
ncbi:MAG TPA: DUF4145 domain-containing protein [Blastocatellia bacterium]|nr:DUF4145 domain-containing protein [Blastocatellia bacterium]